MKQKTISLGVLLLGLIQTVQAQQGIATTGGNASGSGGTLAYSIGLAAFATTPEQFLDVKNANETAFARVMSSSDNNAAGLDLVRSTGVTNWQLSNLNNSGYLTLESSSNDPLFNSPTLI